MRFQSPAAPACLLFAQLCPVFTEHFGLALLTYGREHTSVDPDWTGLGGVLTALTVTALRGQTEAATQLI